MGSLETSAWAGPAVGSVLEWRSCWKRHIPVDYVCFEMLSALPAAGAPISCPCLQQAACLAHSLPPCPSSAGSPCFTILYPPNETEIAMCMYSFGASREEAFSSLAGCDIYLLMSVRIFFADMRLVNSSSQYCFFSQGWNVESAG